MMKQVRSASFAVFLIAAATARAASAQDLVFKLRDGDQPRPMTAAELSQLADPLFRLVIQKNPKPLGLTAIEEAIQPDAAKRRTFVVSEQIHQSGGPADPRAVLAFTGAGPGGVDVNGTVFLSVFFNSSPQGSRSQSLSFPDLQAVEALAWDSTRKVYNYYKLERVHGAGFVWNFRGSSRDADILQPSSRAGSCFACHTNGGPVMKELLFPWNNWHTRSTNPVAGLISPDASRRWPIARQGSGDPRLTEPRLEGGDDLELMILPALQRFNAARLEALRSPPGTDGQVSAASGKRLLRPLFETVEVNFISSRQQSGLNPSSSDQPGRPGTNVCLPGSLLLNTSLMTSLGVDQARSFDAPAACPEGHPFAVDPDEYRDLLARAGQSLGGSPPQDVHFAWFVPEPSFVDNNMVEQLIREGAITPQFAAAVLAVDLRTPVFSADRASFLTFVPETFRYSPLGGADPLAANRHPDALTREVIARLEAASLPAGSPAAEFLVLLRQGNPVDELRRRVARYREELDGRLAAGSPSRGSELERLHNLARARREHVRATEPFNNLVESPVLLPR